MSTKYIVASTPEMASSQECAPSTKSHLEAHDVLYKTFLRKIVSQMTDACWFEHLDAF